MRWRFTVSGNVKSSLLTACVIVVGLALTHGALQPIEAPLWRALRAELFRNRILLSIAATMVLLLSRKCPARIGNSGARGR